MKTIIKGYKRVKTYSYESVAHINDDGTKSFIEQKQPSLKIVDKRHPEIVMFEIPERIVFNDLETDICDLEINISETETVSVNDIKYRADLNEIHVIVNKDVICKEVGKEEAEKMMLEELKEYRKYIIEHTPLLKDYCDLNKLAYEDSDIDMIRRILNKPVIMKRIKTRDWFPSALPPYPFFSFDTFGDTFDGDIINIITPGV